VSLENTEIGCHIKIDSSPNIYETDAQAMIQLFEVWTEKFFIHRIFDFYCLKAFVILQ